ncbi:MAG: cytochrome C [Deltaproteobacteria bacterium]|jgi:c(7)-type cytochrome triheme protein|nr:cytochrome C [Deltaproteobacteria bacterium]
MNRVICSIVISLALAAVALAVPSGKIIEFNNSPMGLVKFDGDLHKEAGGKCKDCHNDAMFPKMKQGSITISMEEIYAGRLCGVCHNGQRAFDAKGNCDRCHIKQ